MRWTKFDRALCISAALLGLATFGLALYGVSEPRLARPGWLLIVGIIALLVGLSFASVLIGATAWTRWSPPLRNGLTRSP